MFGSFPRCSSKVAGKAKIKKEKEKKSLQYDICKEETKSFKIKFDLWFYFIYLFIFMLFEFYDFLKLNKLVFEFQIIFEN